MVTTVNVRLWVSVFQFVPVLPVYTWTDFYVSIVIGWKGLDREYLWCRLFKLIELHNPLVSYVHEWSPSLPLGTTIEQRGEDEYPVCVLKEEKSNLTYVIIYISSLNHWRPQGAALLLECPNCPEQIQNYQTAAFNWNGTDEVSQNTKPQTEKVPLLHIKLWTDPIGGGGGAQSVCRRLGPLTITHCSLVIEPEDVFKTDICCASANIVCFHRSEYPSEDILSEHGLFKVCHLWCSVHVAPIRDVCL